MNINKRLLTSCNTHSHMVKYPCNAIGQLSASDGQCPETLLVQYWRQMVSGCTGQEYADQWALSALELYAHFFLLGYCKGFERGRLKFSNATNSIL